MGVESFDDADPVAVAVAGGGEFVEESQVGFEEVGAEAYAEGRFPEAIRLFQDLSLADTFEDFLTIPAYQLID